MVSKAKESATELSDKSGDLLEKAKTGANDAAASIKQTTSEIKKRLLKLVKLPATWSSSMVLQCSNSTRKRRSLPAM